MGYTFFIDLVDSVIKKKVIRPFNRYGHHDKLYSNLSFTVRCLPVDVAMSTGVAG